MRSTTLLFSLLSFLLLAVLSVADDECSATKKCATGCCSKFGFCGTGDDHCGDGCLSTCDFKLECDADNPCANGVCCSKFGFCGLGEDFCSSENCVSGCDAKAECDPGTFGADFVQVSKCPLNVCCSKWGYCGATAEFCGDKKVKRPSCSVDSTEPIKRVVGYYEGWAARRSCQAYMPEDVPLGVYTHVNFAFASIDPRSYKVVPAQAEDIALYSRLTALKKQDSALKVFIAIGGWTFNDPGPTISTFSELAADEAKQNVFFASLISFMSTYGFDGVDLDWEYPVDPDRGGNEADFANYPKFLQNLKAALDTSAGGRNGISITLPVSFWYLQNFDIGELQKWVDFINVMSYDLHGLWDKGNKWLGAYLNSHTNMTEITEYLDLFWRNDVKPEKVTLGLAFYSRTFLMADKGCTKPGCLFDSVGDAGPCSKDDVGGTLTNAELTDEIRKAGVTPTLDKDAMVKIAVVGRKWITYDDEDTFKLKADAARKLCLGGVMVWAVSQDYTDKTAQVAAAVGKKAKRASGLFDTLYSTQLQSATQYKSMKAVTVHSDADGDIDQPTPDIIRDQCYWANCGVSCGKGYTTVPRLDTDSRKNEVMQDSYLCQGGTLRQFCCPSAKTIPKCGWFDFYNGKCGKKGGCPAGSEDIVAPSDQQREVGSTQQACNNGKAQVACCQTETSSGTALDSMLGYDTCKWYGITNNDCDSTGAIGNDPDIPRSEACKMGDSDRPYVQFETYWGSGATYCRNSNYGSQDMYRPLCCKVDDAEMQWRNCKKVFATRKDGNFCEATCPDGTIRMGMEKPEVYENCKGGGNAMCCEPRFLTEANNADEVHHGYVLALGNVIQNPDKCDWSDVVDDLAKRGDASDLENRAIVDWLADCEVALQGTMNMLGSPDYAIRVKYENDWNLAVNQASMYGIPATSIREVPDGYAYSTAPSMALKTDVAEAILMGAKELNSMKTKPKKTEWNCPLDWLWDAGLGEYRTDPDDGGEETIEPDLGIFTLLLRRDGDHVSDNVSDRGPVARAVKEEEEVKPEEHRVPPVTPPVTPSGSDAAGSPLGHVDWHEGLKNLRRFYLKDTAKDKTADHAAKKTWLGPRDAAGCEKSFRCRGGMLGFDLSKRDDRLAYHNYTVAEAQGKPTRLTDALERRNRRKNGTLSARQSYQMGQPRAYTVKSSRYSLGQWTNDIIESSEYPNGNQGDDLRTLNGDPSRYVVKSSGCGPQDYELKTQAAFGDTNGIWVSEHILELNTIGRFMTASLDGGLGAFLIGSLPGFYFAPANIHQVQMFAYNFVAWNEHTALTPADTCLNKLGSMESRNGLVVCDSSLNMMKTRLYKLQNPIGDANWATSCIIAQPWSLQRALSFIQTIMGVFDYYDDLNVKTRHGQVYQDVMEEMAYFEISYDSQFSLDIYGEWQQRWKEFMTAHFARVVTHTRIWLQNKLNSLYTTWEIARLANCPGNFAECAYCTSAVWLITQYRMSVEQYQKVVFDDSIFDDLLVDVPGAPDDDDDMDTSWKK